jgi:hypothetical protein
MNAPFSINRRQLLQRAGFLALSFAIPLGPAGAAELPSDLKDTPMLSAWLRINAAETVTLMIGKVELGQGNVTAVAQVCADELVIDMARLKITQNSFPMKVLQPVRNRCRIARPPCSRLLPRSGKFCLASLPRNWASPLTE